MRRLVFFVATLTALTLALPGTALAAKPQIFHDRIDEGPFPEELCGIPVMTEIEGHSVTQLRVNRDGLIEVSGNFNATITWTNPATGLSVVNVVHSPFRDISVTENEDGSLTILSATTGIPEWLQTPDGTTLLKDRGRIVFEVVFDDNGTPENFEDDLFTQEIVSVSGPHPEAESDFELFCEVVIEALT
jgi:hypothetical protein